MDVFYDGGWIVRLSVQRLLILWLCLFSGSLSAYQAWPGGDWVRYGNSYGWCGASPNDVTLQQAQDAYDQAASCHTTDFHSIESYFMANCEANNPGKCEYMVYEDVPPYQSGTNTQTGQAQYTAKYLVGVFYYTGPQKPEDCAEQGKLFNPLAGDGAECVLTCSAGDFNGVCLSMPEPDPDECTPESPDYRGELVLGYGTPPQSMCGDYDQCSGTGGQVGVFNGEVRCLAEDYGAPRCAGGTIQVIDDYGFTCETLADAPDNSVPEAPNTDTDGDGVPDEYHRENDPESIDKGLDRLNETVADGNTATEKTNQQLSKIQSVMEGIGADVGSIRTMGENGELAGGGGGSGSSAGLVNSEGEDYLGDLSDIKQNTLDTAERAQALNDGIEPPEQGYETTDFEGIIPTFGESSVAFKAAIMQMPVVQKVTSISFPENFTCPVYTIPPTPFSGELTMDVHCSIIEQHRGTMSAMFLFFWGLLALFLFLRA
ncbi:hypothetical protein [Marinobacter salsuginis]|uniref:hypothetical protein n=1 Tax=Marinobacter salsuginis TaxID=418719 RepID=UPI00273EC812|nr:hypothetical protein [Marinobacter salsuginis]